MAVPSSGPISFSVIASNLDPVPPSPYSLNDMANSAGFSSPHSVGEFYGYSPGGGGGAVGLTITVNGDYDPGKSCAAGPGEQSQQVYWSGPGVPIFPGAFIYTDIDLLYPFDGQGFWFYLFDNNTVLQIHPNGEIIDIFKCDK
jgi:hypothetical protein